MKTHIENFIAMLSGCFLISLPFVLFACTPPAHASDSDETIKDYQGRDKGQHFDIGLVSAGGCNLVFNAAKNCFIASEVVGLGTQLYALKTNPLKRRREAAYDFLANTIGAGLGIALSNGALVYFSHENRITSINVSMQVK